MAEIQDEGNSDRFLEGTSEDDTIDVQGTVFEIVSGGGGDDTITGNAGHDIVRGGSGDDTIYGGANNDVMRGDGGNDSIYGGTGNDSLMGDAGDDIIEGGEGDDDIMGGAGSDTLTGGAGADTFIFDAGDTTDTDTITDFDVDHDKINLKLLPNEIAAHTDLTFGTDSDGNVTITHADLGSTIVLEGVTDATSLTASNFELPDPQDSISVNTGSIGKHLDPWEGTEDGEFVLFGSLGSTQNGNGGNDRLFGGEGDDTMNGGAGNDFIVGEEGADTIDGGADDDVIYGGEGDDTITGGTGDDTMTGGEGADTFVFAAGHGDDTITDFENGTDTIDLSAFSSITGFSQLTITQDGDDTKIDLSSQGGGEIILEDFNSADLDAADFDFYSI